MSVERKEDAFPSTHWSEVRLATAPDFEARRQALDNLLTRYSRPLKRHLAAKYNLAEDRVEDLLQEFVLQRVILQELFGKADSARGRFRTFVLSSLDNFVSNQIRKERALKRSPEGGHVTFHDLPSSEEPCSEAGGGESLDVAWARAVLWEAMVRMKRECERQGRLRTWEVLSGRLLRPTLLDEAPMPYDQLVSKLGHDSPAHLYKALNSAKEMLGQMVRRVIAEYAMNAAEVDSELRDWKVIFTESGVLDPASGPPLGLISSGRVCPPEGK